MERWIGYAIVSTVFAGCTSVIAKRGLDGISGELGLTVRTVFVAVFVFAFAAVSIPRGQLATLGPANYVWLGLSGITTAVSWVFYHKAIKAGEVSTVALIDKGSFVVAVVLAWLLLGEKITPRLAAGCLLIVAGLWIVSRK